MAFSLRMLSLIALLVIGLIAGCGQSKDPQKLLAQSKQSHEKGDNKAAFVLLNSALQSDPNIAEARYLLAVIEYEAGDYPSAEKEFRKALELGFDRAKVVAPLAWTLLNRGEYQTVLDETKSAPESAEILSVRGRAQLILGDLKSAANSFERALKLKPQFPAAVLGQARLAVAERKYDRALELVDSVLARTSKDLDAWLVAGELYFIQTKNDKAAAAFSQALQIQPANVIARLRRASIFAETGRFDAAQADIDSARKIAPQNPSVDYTQALLLYRQGKLDKALEAMQRSLRIAPDNAPSLLLAGMLEYSLNSLAQAEQHVKRFLDRTPQSFYARRLLVSIQLKGNQSKRALETLQPALKTAQPDAQVLALAGEAYMQLKQFAKAEEYLRRAVAMAPTDADLRTKVGLASLAAGETDRAIVELESASKLDKNLSQADTLLIMTYLGKQDYGKALQAALELQKKQPENSVTYDLLGGAYLGKKDVANARKSLERALSLQPDYMSAALMLTSLDLQSKNPDAARKRLNTILDKNGKNIQAMIGMASIEQATGHPSEYASWLEKARSADSTALAPRLLLVSYYLQAKDPERARTVALEAKTIQPNHPDVLSLLGEAQSARGDRAGAVATLSSLVTLMPQSPLAHYQLATAYMANQDFAAAAESLRKALKLKADYVDAEAALALLELRAARFGESLSLAQQIQRQAPKYEIGYALEGDSLMAQKKFALAEKAYEKAFALRNTSAFAVKLHSAASQAGKGKEANARLLQWLKEHPDDTAARLYLADAYVKTHENQLAIKQYQLVLEKDPKSILAVNNLATIYRQEKDPRALDYFEQSYKLKPDSVTITDNLGWILVEQGKLARGLELLRKAATQDPNNPVVRYHLAVALARSGEKAEARRELERLLASKGEFPHRDEAQALLKQL